MALVNHYGVGELARLTGDDGIALGLVSEAAVNGGVTFGTTMGGRTEFRFERTWNPIEWAAIAQMGWWKHPERRWKKAVSVRSWHDGPVRYCGPQHVLTLAPSRSGKGTTAIVPTLTWRQGPLFVIDPKGQNAALTYEFIRQWKRVPAYCINPFGEPKSAPGRLPQHGFNPLASLKPEAPGFVADASALADALIVTDAKEPHWGEAARALVSGIIMHLASWPGETATLARMRAILTSEGEKFHQEMGQMMASAVPAVRQRVGRFAGSASKEVESVLATAITQTAFLDDPEIAATLSGSDFTMEEMKERGAAVFVVLPAKYLETYGRFLRLLVVSGLNAALGSPKSQHGDVLFVLDEFAALEAVQLARLVHKHEVAPVAACQDPARARQRVGEFLAGRRGLPQGGDGFLRLGRCHAAALGLHHLGMAGRALGAFDAVALDVRPLHALVPESAL